MDQKRPGIYYGWWVVAASFFMLFYASGVIYFSFTAVFEPIASEFGWSYAEISLAASLRGVETGILAPLIGYINDRWGPRKLLFGGTIITGAGLMLISRINSLGMFYGAFVLIAIGVGTCGGPLFMTVVVNWFRRKLALATGITASGVAIGGLMIPLVSYLIDSVGWRATMMYSGVGMLIVGLPVSLIMRQSPEKIGILPDGDRKPQTPAGTAALPVQDMEITNVSQALRTRVFWHLSLSLLLQSLSIHAVLVHIMPYLTTIGVNRTSASLIASAVPITTLFGRLGFGWWGDRSNKKVKLMTLVFLLTSLGLIFFGGLAFWGLWLLLPFIICFGLGWGGAVTMRVALLREYFGRSRFGTIHGFVVGVMTFGTISGPPLAGWVFDTWGSYQIIWFIIAGMVLVSLVINATTPPPAGKTDRL